MKIAAIILTFVAIAGAVFSGYAFMATQTKMTTLARGVGGAMNLQQETTSFDWKTPEPFVTAVSNKYKEIDTARKKAENEADTTKKQLQQAQMDLDIAEEQSNTLKEQVKDRSRKLSEAQDTVAEQERELTKRQDRIAKLEADIVQYQNAVPEISEEQYQAALEAAEELQGTVDGLKEQLTELSKELEDWKSRGTDTGEVEYKILAQGTPILEIAPEVGLIVLGAGSNLGESYVPNARVTLRKDGRRLARLQIISVQGSKSVANILPGYGFPQALSAQDSVEILQ